MSPFLTENKFSHCPDSDHYQDVRVPFSHFRRWGELQLSFSKDNLSPTIHPDLDVNKSFALCFLAISIELRVLLHM